MVQTSTEIFLSAFSAVSVRFFHSQQTDLLLHSFQFKLFLTGTRGKTSHFKTLLLIVTAGLMHQLNWGLQHLSRSEYRR